MFCNQSCVGRIGRDDEVWHVTMRSVVDRILVLYMEVRPWSLFVYLIFRLSLDIQCTASSLFFFLIFPIDGFPFPAYRSHSMAYNDYDGAEWACRGL